MALQPCPECGSQVSSLAASCPSCGCPASAAKAPAAGKSKKSKPAGHVGTVPGCLVILLTFVGIAVVASRNSSPDRPPQQQAPARRAAAKRPTPPPPPSFDAQIAAKGKELHARLLAETNVHEFYLSGSLFGAVTPEPKASIAVPMNTWKALGGDERAELMHYAASLVEPMRRDPLAFCQIPASAPAAGMVRENASKMGPRSWVIHGGRLDGSDILTDEAVASGAEDEQRVAADAQAAAKARRAAEDQRAAQAKKIADARAEAFKEALALTGDWSEAQSMLDGVVRSIQGRDDLLIEFMSLVDSGTGWRAAQSIVAQAASGGR